MRDPQDSTQQVFGPVFVPAKNIPKESWLPLYPDRVLPRTSVLAAAVPFFFFTFALAQLPVPALSWAPTYPDQPRVARTHASAAPAVFYQPALPQFPIPALSWKGVFPDRIDPTQGLHASRQAFLFRFLIPQPPAPLLSWGPVYPDRALGPAGLRAEYQRAWQANYDPITTFDPASLAWRALYADQVRRTTNTGEGWTTPVLPFAVVLTQGWYPDYPDVSLRVPPPPVGWYARPTIEPPDIARYEWSPVYPDRIDRFRPDGSGWSVRPLREPDDIARYGWTGSQPALINRLRLIEPGQSVYAFVQAIVATVPPLSWNGLYPDRALGPNGLHASRQWVTARNYVPIVLNVDAFGFRGSYPDWLNRKPTHPAWAPAYFDPASYLPTQPVVPLSWHPLYPDRHVPRVLTPGAIPTTFFGRPPIVPFVPAIYPVRLDPAARIILTATTQPYLIVVQQNALDWLPIYVHIIRARGFHPSLGQATFRFDFPQRATGAGASAGWGLAWGGGGAGGSA